ncbi:MAG TPA: aldehyde dehydrogenase family protein [Rhodopila sp.]|nr:aldehyde dehydrogenase family protein [Rhodopila sp.]
MFGTDALSMADILDRSRQAARIWRDRPLGLRLQVIARVRRLIAAEAISLADSLGQRRPAADTLTAEVLPLAEAARFLERQAAHLLAPRRPGRRGRPAWLAGVSVEIRREPCGVVLILAPANYPLFLPAVQILQALAAGNAICAKPAMGCAAPLTSFADMLRRSGLPDGVLMILDEDISTGEAASRAGFDKIVLTGAAATGVAVLQSAADRLTPCTMELSGDDPVFVLPGADLSLVAAAVAYGTRLNDGQTCIAPRRIFAPVEMAQALERLLAASCPAPPPVIPVRDAEDALARAAASPYALGAAIFGPDAQARDFAARVDAGCVVINDVIVPTADPRLPFGGRRRSGFGVTRGAEGLLEMTVIKSIAVRRGRFRPHLNPPATQDGAFFAAMIAVLHGDRRTRLLALPALASAARRIGWRRR